MAVCGKSVDQYAGRSLFNATCHQDSNQNLITLYNNVRRSALALKASWYNYATVAVIQLTQQ